MSGPNGRSIPKLNRPAGKNRIAWRAYPGASQVLRNRCSQRACPAFGPGSDRCGLSPWHPSCRISRRSAFAIPPGPPKDTGQCPQCFARGVLIATVHRLARASLPPSGPSPLSPYPHRIPNVVPLTPGLEVLRWGYGGDEGGLAPGQRGERGHLGRQDAVLTMLFK